MQTLTATAITPITIPKPTLHVNRFDLYGQVHKGLRAFMCDTLVELGKLDSGNDHEVKRVLDQLDELLDYCISHIAKEDTYVHAAMQARDPNSIQIVSAEHKEHAAAIEQLRVAAHAVACAGAVSREGAAGRLYSAFSRFVAENLEHMHLEESKHNAFLWAHFSDEELADIYGAIMAATSSADMALGARWIVPFLTPSERAALIEGLRATMPGEVFDAVYAIIRPHLPRAEQAPTLNAQIVQRFVEAVFLRFDADEAARLATADFIAHPWAPLGVPPGPAGIGPVVAAFRTAFDQVRVTLDDVLADGDRVAIRYRYAGRHCGDLFGIPATGRNFDMAGILVARVAHGKVAEYWREEDMLGLQQQLGLASLQPAA
jgi:ketosteroid isomerase-like protein